LFAIAHAAVVFAPRHFARISRQVRPRDMVMNANFSATQAS
jgi:hypothetical protein